MPELVITAVLVLTFVTAKKPRVPLCPPPVARPVGELPKGTKPLTRRAGAERPGERAKPEAPL